MTLNSTIFVLTNTHTKSLAAAAKGMAVQQNLFQEEKKRANELQRDLTSLEAAHKKLKGIGLGPRVLRIASQYGAYQSDSDDDSAFDSDG